MLKDSFSNQPLPHSVEAEQSVLGAAILDAKGFGEILEFLSPEDFYDEKHRIIFIAIRQLFNYGTPVDLLTLTNKLDGAGYLQSIGGTSYLAELANSVPTTSNIKHYAKIVQEKSFLRSVIDQASKIAEASYAEPDSVGNFLRASSERFVDVYKKFNESTGVDNPETQIISLKEAAEKLEAESGGSDKFPIGFKVFSEVMGTKGGGVMDGDLVVISGKSGHGKTTFAQTLSYHLSKLGLPQLWFSYEMQVTEIWEKFKAMGIDEEFLGFCPMKLESGNVDFIERKIDEAIEKQNVKIVFIDHLGFLTPKITERNAKEFERNYSAYLGQLVRQLKVMALEKKIIIFLLAHVRKTKEELDIDDIAHSVGIAQEADFVFMVERERLPEPKSKPSPYPKTGMSLEEEKSPMYAQGNVYSKFSRVLLVKNRRTGISKYVKCELVNGKLQEVQSLEERARAMFNEQEIIIGD